MPDRLALQQHPRWLECRAAVDTARRATTQARRVGKPQIMTTSDPRCCRVLRMRFDGVAVVGATAERPHSSTPTHARRPAGSLRVAAGHALETSRSRAPADPNATNVVSASRVRLRRADARRFECERWATLSVRRKMALQYRPCRAVRPVRLAAAVVGRGGLSTPEHLLDGAATGRSIASGRPHAHPHPHRRRRLRE